MLIDIHSHFFRSPDHFSKDFMGQAKRAAGGGPGLKLDVLWEDYHSEAKECDWTVVFGGKAALAGLWVPDDEIVEYTKSHADKTIGFLSVDPTQPGWQDELQHGHQDLKLKGIKLMPMYAGFHPNDRKLDHLWEYATKNHLPVLLHSGTTFVSQAPLDCTLPLLVDDVGIRFPHVKIIMAHLSHPYGGECAVTIRKHPNVYADCSALYFRPFQLYHSLMLVQEYRVWEKVLFGSDYPFATVSGSVTGMRRLNQMLEGTALPRLDMGQMEAMFRRNSLELLEIDV
jgi:predicted TIM-barrel fold metal-dependent hydrolase